MSILACSFASGEGRQRDVEWRYLPDRSTNALLYMCHSRMGVAR